MSGGRVVVGFKALINSGMQYGTGSGSCIMHVVIYNIKYYILLLLLHLSF